MSVIFVTACGAKAPPDLLNGVWARGEAACRAGITARFGANAVTLAGPEGERILLDRPRYTLAPDARVTIRFELPQAPGGAAAGGGEGILVLDGVEDGRLTVASRRFVDRRTGAVTAALVLDGDPLAETLSLVRCDRAGSPSEGARLRGRL